MEPGVQTCEETLERRMGSCRDSAWLLVQILRHLGIAVAICLRISDPVGTGRWTRWRVDSGRQRTQPICMHGRKSSCRVRVGSAWIRLQDCSLAKDTFRWCARPARRKAAPIGGTVEPANVEFSFSMSVRRLNEAPRLSKPFSEEDWAKVEEVAHAVDADLKAQDVRLTMGGEPTFRGARRAGESAVEY